MITIDGNSLAVRDVVRVSREDSGAVLDKKALPVIKKSRAYVDRIIQEGRIVYGINTGVGELSNCRISPEDTEKLQLNLVRSHATSVGEPFTEDVVRGIILLRANALAKGYSGVRPEVIELLLSLLNEKVF